MKIKKIMTKSYRAGKVDFPTLYSIARKNLWKCTHSSNYQLPSLELLSHHYPRTAKAMQQKINQEKIRKEQTLIKKFKKL